MYLQIKLKKATFEKIKKNLKETKGKSRRKIMWRCMCDEKHA